MRIARPVNRGFTSRLVRDRHTGPPLEHALRHLSWLIRDDHAIADALPEWSSVLSDYQPEPFRSLD